MIVICIWYHLFTIFFTNSFKSKLIFPDKEIIAGSWRASLDAKALCAFPSAHCSKIIYIFKELFCLHRLDGIAWAASPGRHRLDRIAWTASPGWHSVTASSGGNAWRQRLAGIRVATASRREWWQWHRGGNHFQQGWTCSSVLHCR